LRGGFTEIIQITRRKWGKLETYITFRFNIHHNRRCNLSWTRSWSQSLLPYHCDLKANDCIWNVVKSRVGHHIVGRSETVTENVMACYRKCKFEDWKKMDFVCESGRKETDCWARARILEEGTEETVMNGLWWEDSGTGSSSNSDSSVSGREAGIGADGVSGTE
jgi:hypothetical protein